MVSWITPRITNELPFVTKDVIENEVKNDLTYLKDNTIPLPTSVQGNVLYYNGTSWVVLAPGTSGYFLKTQGAAANPVWGAVDTTTCPMRDGSTVAYASPSGTRAKGTVYQNTSGKIRFVSLCIYGAAADDSFTVHVGATSTPTVHVASYTAVAVNDVKDMFFVVPPSYYYQVLEDVATATIAMWVEWDIL